MPAYDVLVFSGYRYELETVIYAETVHQARKQWAQRGDWKSEKFKIRRRMKAGKP